MQCCRICLSSSDLTNIFSTKNTAQQICAFAAVQLQENDGFPQYICVLCKHELDICVNFRDKCETNYEILKKNKAKVHLNNNVLLNVIDNSKNLPGIAKNFYECVKENVETSKVKSETVEAPVVNGHQLENSEFEYRNYSTNSSTVSKKNPYIENGKNDHLPLQEKGVNESLSNNLVLYGEECLGSEIDAVESCSFETWSFSSDGAWSEDLEIEEELEEEIDVLFEEHEDLTCSFCNFYFKSEEALKSHLEIIHRNTKEQCQICLSEFPDYSVFFTHLKRRHDITIENDTPVSESRSHISHQDVDLNSRDSKDNELSVNCKCCKRSFLTESDLKTHMDINNSSPILTCKYCGDIFHLREKLVLHLKSHDEEYVECDQCGKYFKNNASFKIHEKLHLRVREYACKDCQRKFLTQWDLCRHTRMVHEKHVIVENGEKYSDCYICDVCGNASLKMEEYKKHLEIHEDRPFVCPLCETCFKTSSILEKHIRVHTGEKNSHKAVHNALQPHSCSVCARGFWKIGSLEKHWITHNEMQIEKSEN